MRKIQNMELNKENGGLIEMAFPNSSSSSLSHMLGSLNYGECSSLKTNFDDVLYYRSSYPQSPNEHCYFHPKLDQPFLYQQPVSTTSHPFKNQCLSPTHSSYTQQHQPGSHMGHYLPSTPFHFSTSLNFNSGVPMPNQFYRVPADCMNNPLMPDNDFCVFKEFSSLYSTLNSNTHYLLPLSSYHSPLPTVSKYQTAAPRSSINNSDQMPLLPFVNQQPISPPPNHSSTLPYTNSSTLQPPKSISIASIPNSICNESVHFAHQNHQHDHKYPFLPTTSYPAQTFPIDSAEILHPGIMKDGRESFSNVNQVSHHYNAPVAIGPAQEPAYKISYANSNACSGPRFKVVIHCTNNLEAISFTPISGHQKYEVSYEFPAFPFSPTNLPPGLPSETPLVGSKPTLSGSASNLVRPGSLVNKPNRPLPVKESYVNQSSACALKKITLPYPGKMFPTLPGARVDTISVHNGTDNNNYFCSDCKEYINEFARCWQCSLENLAILFGYLCANCIPKFRTLPFLPIELLDRALACHAPNMNKYVAVPPNLFTRISEFGGPLKVTQDSHTKIFQVLAQTQLSATPLSPWSKFMTPAHSTISINSASLSSSMFSTEIISSFLGDSPNLFNSLGITPRLMISGRQISSPAISPNVSLSSSMLYKRPLSTPSSPLVMRKRRKMHRLDSAVEPEQFIRVSPVNATYFSHQDHSNTLSNGLGFKNAKIVPQNNKFTKHMPAVSHQVFPFHVRKSSKPCHVIAPDMIGNDEDEEIWIVDAPLAIPSLLGTGTTSRDRQSSFPSFEFPVGQRCLQVKQHIQNDHVSEKMSNTIIPRFGGRRKYLRQPPRRPLDISTYVLKKSAKTIFKSVTTSSIQPPLIPTVTRNIFEHETPHARGKLLVSSMKQSSKKNCRKSKVAGLKLKLAPLTFLPKQSSPRVSSSDGLSRVAKTTHTDVGTVLSYLPTPTSPKLQQMGLNTVRNDTIYTILNKFQIPWCRFCGTTNTPNWRKGPWGRKTLCNRHGCAWNGISGSRKRRLDLSLYINEAIEDRKGPIYHECTLHFQHVKSTQRVSNQLTTSQNSGKMIIPCSGCQRAYHVGCILKSSPIASSNLPNFTTDPLSLVHNTWFCSDLCRVRYEIPVNDSRFCIDDAIPIKPNPLTLCSLSIRNNNFNL